MDDSLFNSKGDFNMAAATLQRIHTSLERIRLIFEYYQGVQKQRAHIEEVKIFFMMASPLLKDETIVEHQKEIDGLKLRAKSVKGKKMDYYDFGLEKRLFELVRIISIELRPYFMRYKEDPSRAIISN